MRTATVFLTLAFLVVLAVAPGGFHGGGFHGGARGGGFHGGGGGFGFHSGVGFRGGRGGRGWAGRENWHPFGLGLRGPLWNAGLGYYNYVIEDMPGRGRGYMHGDTWVSEDIHNRYFGHQCSEFGGNCEFPFACALDGCCRIV